jgi:hypothetical protein
MKKVSKPSSATKPAQKRPAQKKLATKPAKPKKAQGGAGLAEVVAQLALSAEKLAQAADRLAEATARLSVTGGARHETLEAPGHSTADSIASPQESEAADATDSE